MGNCCCWNVASCSLQGNVIAAAEGGIMLDASVEASHTFSPMNATPLIQHDHDTWNII